MTSKYLTSSEIMKYVRPLNLEVGGTRRFNHEGCATSSQSNSLQIWRTKDGFNAWCFKCNKSGRVTTTPVSVHIPEGSGRALDEKLGQLREYTGEDGSLYGGLGRADHASLGGTAPKRFRVPRDTTYRTSTFPRWGRELLDNCGISGREVEENHLGYSAYLDRIILPVVSLEDGVPSGYIARGPAGSTPKYTNYYKGRATFVVKQNNPSIVCVVEDVLSAVKCGRYCTTYALLTTTASPGLMKKLYEYPKVIIFLDNDNEQVRKNQRKLYKDLSLLVPCVILVKQDRDPKHLSDAALKELLK